MDFTNKRGIKGCLKPTTLKLNKKIITSNIANNCDLEHVKG